MGNLITTEDPPIYHWVYKPSKANDNLDELLSAIADHLNENRTANEPVSDPQLQVFGNKQITDQDKELLEKNLLPHLTDKETARLNQSNRGAREASKDEMLKRERYFYWHKWVFNDKKLVSFDYADRALKRFFRNFCDPDGVPPQGMYIPDNQFYNDFDFYTRKIRSYQTDESNSDEEKEKVQELITNQTTQIENLFREARVKAYNELVTRDYPRFKASEELRTKLTTNHFADNPTKQSVAYMIAFYGEDLDQRCKDLNIEVETQGLEEFRLETEKMLKDWVEMEVCRSHETDLQTSWVIDSFDADWGIDLYVKCISRSVSSNDFKWPIFLALDDLLEWGCCQNEEFMRKAVQTNGDYLRFAYIKIRYDNKIIINALIAKFDDAIYHVPRDKKLDNEITEAIFVERPNYKRLAIFTLLDVYNWALEVKKQNLDKEKPKSKKIQQALWKSQLQICQMKKDINEYWANDKPYDELVTQAQEFVKNLDRDHHCAEVYKKAKRKIGPSDSKLPLVWLALVRDTSPEFIDCILKTHFREHTHK